MNDLTVPRMNLRQIGQCFRAGAHITQAQRCPQGRNTMEDFSSRQILHKVLSFSWRFSFSSVTPEKNKGFLLQNHSVRYIDYIIEVQIARYYGPAYIFNSISYEYQSTFICFFAE